MVNLQVFIGVIMLQKWEPHFGTAGYLTNSTQ
jgi:hypothetical protein